MLSTIFALLISLNLSSVTLAAPTTVESDAASRAWQAWTELKSAVADKSKTADEKSIAVDEMFKKLESMCDEGCDYVLNSLNRKLDENSAQSETAPRTEKLDARAAVEKWADDLLTWFSDQKIDLPFDRAMISKAIDRTFSKSNVARQSGTPEESQGVESAFDRFLQKANNKDLRPRVLLAIKILRQVIQLEERTVFTLITDGDNKPRQIQAGADLTRDIYFLYKQGRALTRLFQIGMEVYQKNGLVSASDVETLKSADMQQMFDQSFPKLVQATDDLGIYYAKLAQTFAAFVYYFSPEAYAKIDYFQGQMPKKMSYQQVKEIIEEDLGKPIEEAYAEFDREPFANQTIAQIHWAKVRDRKGRLITVAVKVQKEFVAQELKMNMATNDIFFGFLEGITPNRGKALTRFFVSQARSIGETYRGELDFVGERNRQGLFGSVLRAVPGLKVPRVFRAHSGRRIITTLGVCNAQRIHMVFESKKACETPANTTQSPDDIIASVEPTISSTENLNSKETTTSANHASASAEAGNSKPRTQHSANILSNEDLDDEPQGDVGKTFMDLTDKFGYEVGPQYFQFLRAVLPVIAVTMQFYKLKAELTEAGKTKDDIEMKNIEKLLNTLLSGFLFQMLYVKEVHSDYNFGNLLVDQSFDLHLLDWGQTVPTKGLVFRPAVLGLAFMKGDAELVVKKLAQIGKFKDLNRDRPEIVATIQKLMNQQEIKPKSWRKLITEDLMGHSSRPSRSRRSTPSQPNKTTDPVFANSGVSVTQTESKSNSTDEMSTVTVEDTTQTTSAPAGPEIDIKTERKKSISKSDTGKLLGLVAKTLVTYPYHRSRVLAISACNRALGRSHR